MQVALTYETFGNPAEVLHTTTVSTSTLGPHDVRVRLVLSPIHNHDLMIIRGDYGQLPSLPAFPGTEALGIVDEVGSEVVSVRAGQRVACSRWPCWAETFVAPDSALLLVPDAIDDAAGCQLIGMPSSAFFLLDDADLPPGAWLAQNAANGAVGKTLARVAKMRGVPVLNVVRRSAAIDELAKVGIENVVATDTPEFAQRVAAITGGAPIMRGIDSVGGAEAGMLLSVLADNATLVVFGLMSQEPMQVGSGEFIFKHKKVEGFWAGTFKPRPGKPDRKAIRDDIVRLVASKQLELTLEATFPLTEPAAAVTAHEELGRRGKIAFGPAR